MREEWQQPDEARRAEPSVYRRGPPEPAANQASGSRSGRSASSRASGSPTTFE